MRNESERGSAERHEHAKAMIGLPAETGWRVRLLGAAVGAFILFLVLWRWGFLLVMFGERE